MDWYLKVIKEYFNFSGRARRKEFWMFMLFHYIFLFAIMFSMFFSADQMGFEPNSILVILLLVYVFGTLIPSLAVTVRRLHDTNKSGWWILINFLPYIGGFVLLIFSCMDSYNSANKWGENPKKISNDRFIDQIGRE